MRPGIPAGKSPLPRPALTSENPVSSLSRLVIACGNGQFHMYQNVPSGVFIPNSAGIPMDTHTARFAGEIIGVESGFLEELIDHFCDLLRRVLMAVVTNTL